MTNTPPLWPSSDWLFRWLERLSSSPSGAATTPPSLSALTNQPLKQPAPHTGNG